MKWYKHIVFFLVMTVAAWSAVSLDIQNMDIDAGTLDIYMTNQAGCSYCDDPLYNSQYACEINGNSSELQSILRNGDVVKIITSKNKWQSMK